MNRITALALTAAVFVAMPVTSAFAQDQALQQEIKELYKNKAELLTGERIDIEKTVAEAKKHTRDDAVFVNRLKNLGNGQVTESTMTKDDMISQMPNAYSLTVNSKAGMDVTSIEAVKEGEGWNVGYQLTYSTTLQQRDVYGRVMSTDMSMASACIDNVVRSAEGILQTVRAECDAVLNYTQPEIKAQP